MHELKGEVTIFSIVGCPFCIRAKGKFEELGLPFIDINLDRYKDARKIMIEKTGKKTVPQIFFNGKHIGGWSDFNNMPEEELKGLIDDVTENEAPEDSPAAFLKSVDKEGSDSDDSFEFTCELDEYSYLKKELQESGIVKDIRSGLKTFKNSFYGKDAVSFLVQTKNLDRGHAIAMCKQLVEKHFGKSVKEKGQIEFRDDDTIYRFLEDDQTNALNSDIVSDCEPRDAAEVGEDLRKLILSIYNSHLSADGKKVDYKAIGESAEFKQYQKHTAELKRVNVENASREEKLAFFINVYNALVIHAFVVRGPPTNLWQRYKFFNVVSYVIGGQVYSLNEIENGILRSNRKPLGSFRRPFSKNDPRLQVALEEPEPKIHFALVCGAKSCPPIKTYSAKDIDNQLKLAAESFLEGDDCVVEMTKREVKLSQILKWYKEDFGKTKANILQWVMENMGECEKKKQLAELLESKNFKLNYLPYDWGLNS
ncbi:uncharacterized protein LOC135689250 isoform X2 [Rhopilema esculentum]|uniref:uncharacterized protein LOC135689250 isoform X2 n=1 Tax=Rhopilema esculentum TaxID=499914 RepID=UPI0031E309CB